MHSSGEILVLSVRDVKMGLGITELPGKTRIDDIDLISMFSNAHEEVVRFDTGRAKGAPPQNIHSSWPNLILLAMILS